MEEKRFLRSRLVYLILGALYLLVLIAATVYSLTVYVARLPVAELPPQGAVDGVRVPLEYVRELPDGSWVVDTVKRVDGPWGNRYVISQVRAESVYPVEGDESRVRFYALSEIGDPIVARCSAETFDGMEVRLQAGE